MNQGADIVESYRTLFDMIDEGACLIERRSDRTDGLRDYRFIDMNVAMQTMFGIADLSGHSIRDKFPDEFEAWCDHYDQVLTTGEDLRIERLLNPQGVMIETLLVRVNDGADRRLLIMTKDITARRRADDALRLRENDLARVHRIGGVGGLDIDISGGMRSWRSPEYLRLHGLPPHIREEHHDDWRARVHAEDREHAEAALRAALAGSGSSYDSEYRIIRQSDGAVRWIHARADIERDAEGRATRLVGAHVDVTEQKEMHEALRESEGRLQLLVAELQHRVRNILTGVRSVLSRSLHDADDLEDAVDHFRGRLDALARTQVVVTQSASGTADLETLIRDELLSVGASDGPLLTIKGPAVVLSSKQAEILGLALHELTTNALKYGALKSETARLEILWNINIDQGGTPTLNLCWSEQGVPAIAIHPDREGFGRELIEEALPYRLGAETKLEFRGGGVRCSIAVPLGAVDQASSL